MFQYDEEISMLDVLVCIGVVLFCLLGAFCMFYLILGGNDGMSDEAIEKFVKGE